MNKYLLDTDTASYLIRGDHPEVTAAFAASYQEVCLSAITAAELQYGARKRNNAKLTEKVLALCALVRGIDWDSRAAAAYADLRAELESTGQIIGAMDMLIAASALAEDLILVTNNTKHFSRVKGLKIENWAKDTPAD